MEHLMRFKVAIDKLNKLELINILSSYDTNYITTLFFKYFNLELVNAQSLTEINDIIVPQIQTLTNKVDKTIRSRQTKSNQTSDTNATIENNVDDDEEEFEPIQLDQLPLVMISSISSFLELGDLLNFEKSNKTIFIGTRSPISMNELPLSYSSKLIIYLKQNMNHNRIFYWSRFKSIKQFTVDIDDHINIDYDIVYDYKLSDIAINWNGLTAITIRDTAVDWNGDEEFITDFQRDLAVINVDNVETFNINTSPTHLLPNISNASLKFVNVKYHIDDINLPNDLRGLAIHGDVAQINRDIPKNVESLHLTDCKILYDKGCKFKKLKEICIQELSQKNMDFLTMQNLDNLERIHVAITNLEICTKFIESIFGAPNINYISIRSDHDVVKAINNALRKISIDKGSLKIRITNWFWHKFNQQIFNKQIYQMIQMLEERVEEFMVIGKFDMKRHQRAEEMKKNGNNLLIQSKLEIVDDGICKFKTYKFVISNKECKMSGYHENWIMSCSQCKHDCY